MIARVATFHQLDSENVDPEAVERLRRIIKSTPGYVAGFHLHNPETGKALSFTVFDSPEGFEKVGEGLEQRREDERVGVDPDEVDFYTEVFEF